MTSPHLEAHSASNEAQANKMKVSNLTRFSWILMRRTKKTHHQQQSNPLDKMSGLKYESVRAFQPTIKECRLLPRKSSIISADKVSNSSHSSSQTYCSLTKLNSAETNRAKWTYKVTLTLQSTTSYAYTISYRLAFLLH